jgi:hypothetical protein
MDEARIAAAVLDAHLAHGLEERQRFMPPTVPPISQIATSASPAPIRMKCLISSVMCG